LRLHVRVGIVGNANDGCDPAKHLQKNKLYHVKVAVKTTEVSVYINGVLGCKRVFAGAAISEERRSVFVGDPWHPAANAVLGHTRWGYTV